MLARWTRGVTRDEWLRLSGFGAAVLALHVVGWGLFLYYSGHYRPLVGLGLTAYLFGLRHAFDADHIAAIDNTTRKLLARGQAPGRRRVLLLARALDDRVLAGGRARAGGANGQLRRSRRSRSTAATSAPRSRARSCGSSGS